jgi:radical SAM superfamily enzyme YgiQ (UPF0313 family)
MAKILFIESGMRNEKLGIMYLSAALKQAGHDTLLCCVDKEDIDDCIARFEPDWAAVSLVTGASRKLLQVAEDLRRRYRLAVIAGGPHATFFPHEIPEDAADYVVIGHGERAIVDIVGQKVRTRMVQYPLSDLNRLPFPDRGLIYRYREFRENPMKNVITCRDCPYSCSYCYNHTWKTMFKSQMQFMQRRRVEDVISEISDLKKNWPVEQLLFIDDNFLFNKQWVEEFCNQYSQAIGLPFLCSFSVNLLDENLLAKLKTAGLYMVNFALESADPAVQKEILGRGHVHNAQIIRAIRLLKQFGIKTRMQNMIGLPVKESLKDALNTLAFNQQYPADDSWVSIFQPYPNTRLAKYCQAHGFVTDAGEACADSFFDRSNLNIDSRDKIRRLQKWWYYIIRYNLPDTVVNQLLELDIDKTIEDALIDLRYAYSRNHLYGLACANPSLVHNWCEIKARYGDNRKLGLIEPLIRHHRMGNGLVDILMNIPITGPFIIAAEDTARHASKNPDH